MTSQLSYCTIPTPLGNMCCGVFEEKLVLLEFDHESRATKQIKQLESLLNTKSIEENTSLSQQVQTQLDEYFSKTRKDFELPIHFIGSPFQQKVWNSLLEIPFGRTTSYQQQAIKYGDVKAIRAVARANGENRMGIVVPCHRVIGSNGALTGYAGAVWRKKALLELEGAFSKQGSLF